MLLPLTLVLLSLPAQASLGDHLPRGVHLVEPALLAQADAPLAGAAEPEAPLTVTQLQADITALKRLRPSLGGAVALVSVGLSSSLLGALYLGLGAALGTVTQTTVFLVLGLAFLGVGMPLAILGGWMLYHRLGDRTRIDAELRTLNTQLRQLQQAQPLGPPQPGPVPQGPVPVVEVEAPGLVLAAF